MTSQRDESNSPTSATCRLTFDGYVVLAEASMTIAEPAYAVRGSWQWNLPFGIDGSPHFIGVMVEFR
jgi:hypothetical protein